MAFSPRYPLVSRAGLVLAALAAPAVLVACGTETLDADKAEAQIASSIEFQTGADVTSVDCPDDVKPEKGKRFTCEVTAADGTKATLNLRQTTEEGDVQIGAPVVHVAIMEDFIADGLRMKTGKRATVDCPDLVVARKEGAQLTCRSSSVGKKKNIVVEVDAQGRVTFDPTW